MINLQETDRLKCLNEEILELTQEDKCEDEIKQADRLIQSGEFA